MADTAHPLPHRYAHVPSELRALDQWVVWKKGKVPFNARTGRPASVADPRTWSSFEDAIEALERDADYIGIGFMFAAGGGIFGFDADKQRDPETGAIAPEARAWLDRFATYAEVSPSGTGIHAIGYGTLPGEGKKRAPFEVYDSGRFFTVTGEMLADYPGALARVNGPLDELWALLAAGGGEIPDASPPTGTGESALSDERVIEKAGAAANGAKFRALMAGDTAAYGGDDSGADQALCNILAFWCANDAAQMDRIFRSSGLLRPKWDERRGRRTYGQMTIAEAIRITGTVYAGGAPVAIISKGRRVDPQTGEVLDAGGADESGLPSINLTDKRLRDVVAESLEALARVESLYQRGGALLRMRRDDRGKRITEALGKDALKGILERCADYWAYDGRRKRLMPTSPPMEAVADMLALPDYSFRYLAGIVETPMARADGSIVEAPGYDATSALFYEPPPGLVIPPIPEQPGEVDVAGALALFDELLADFPFADGATGRAHAMALILTPFLRDLIDGPVPLLIVDAPGPGSGKGLLADVCCIPAFGPLIGNLGECGTDDEWRKQITSVLLESTRVIRIDNIAQVLDSASLARALTTAIWEDRILGGNRIGRLPVRCTWIGTGNNVQASSEITRRMVPIRLEPDEERPELRRAFRHANLKEWALGKRGELIAAALTLIRAWHAWGRPLAAQPSLGSYEAWSATLGGLLGLAGVAGFLGHLGDQYDPADSEMGVWQGFVQAWWDKHQRSLVLARDLIELAWGASMPLRGNSPHAQKVELGMALRRQRGRVIAGRKLMWRYNSDNKTTWWWLNPEPKNREAMPTGFEVAAPVEPGEESL